jgi:hypothetical protein
MREVRPGHRIVRATKALAETNWNGSVYRSLYSTPGEIERAIQDLNIDLVVIGTFHSADGLKHNRLLQQALKNGQDCFRLVAAFDGTAWDGAGKVLVYRVIHRYRDAPIVKSPRTS